MAVKTAWIDTATGKTGFTALSSDVLPLAAPGSLAWITDQPGTIKQCDGITWITAQSGGAALVRDVESKALYTPARDHFIDWFFGSDVALSAALTAGSENNGLWIDMREINPNARSIVVQAGSGTSLNYNYSVYFSRSGLTADRYLVATATAVTTEFKQINIPASLGYDGYIQLSITPDALQTGANLTFRAYLVGRGG